MEAEKDIRVDKSSLGRGQETMTVKEAGRRGGLSTLAKHGASHFRRAGAIGGKTTTSRHRNKLRGWGSKGGSSKTLSKNCTVTTNAQNKGSGEKIASKFSNDAYDSRLVSSVGKHSIQQEIGRKGGLSTLERYGRSHMSLIGSLGGRPTFKEGLERTRTARIERSGRASKKEVMGHRLSSAATAYGRNSTDTDW